MSKNEYSYGRDYLQMISDFLTYFSESGKPPLSCLVTGHIQMPEGHKLIGKQQLRLCSSKGAASDADKSYLLLEGQRIYADAEDLAQGVHKLWA